jgi:hypothetical protein
MIDLMTAEFWAALAAGLGAVGTLLYKGYRIIRKEIDELRAKSEVQLNKSVDRAVSEYNAVRGQQIRYAEQALHDYAVVVTQTAEDAAALMVCKPDCDTMQAITELWQHAVHKTITKNVLGYFIDLINQNGFRHPTDAEFERWIDSEVPIVFDCFLTSMRGFFHAKKIKSRIDWIEKYMDRVYMRHVISMIMHECRRLSKKFHEK